MMLDIQYICLSRFRVSLSDKLRFVWPHLLGVKLAGRQNPAESCMICLDPGLRHCKIAPCSTREVSLKMGVDYFSKSLSLCQWFKIIPMLGFISDLRLSQVEFFPTSNLWFPALLLRWLSQPSSLRADSGARPWLPWLPWRGEGRLSLPRPRSKERMAGSLLVSSCHGEGLLKPLIPAPKYQISPLGPPKMSKT